MDLFVVLYGIMPYVKSRPSESRSIEFVLNGGNTLTIIEKEGDRYYSDYFDSSFFKT